MAIWPATSALLRNCCRPRGAACRMLLNGLFSVSRELRSAGTTPKTRAVITASAAVIASKRASIATGGMADCPGSGAIILRARRHTQATNKPRPPPMTDSNKLSVSSCRTIRPRLAPSARRSASSGPRTVPRASKSAATFAHATSSTSATAASTVTSGSVAQPNMTSRTGLASTPHWPPDIASRSAAAAAIVTPGRNRPTTL